MIIILLLLLTVTLIRMIINSTDNKTMNTSIIMLPFRPDNLSLTQFSCNNQFVRFLDVVSFVFVFGFVVVVVVILNGQVQPNSIIRSNQELLIFPKNEKFFLLVIILPFFSSFNSDFVLVLLISFCQSPVAKRRPIKRK